MPGPDGMNPDNRNDYTESSQQTQERSETRNLQATPDQSRTIKDANTLINSIDSNTSAEMLNNQLDATFLENLQNGLSPDDANSLKTKIESIRGYNTPHTPLNDVYNYINDICNVFNTEGSQDHNITNKIDVDEFLDNTEKTAFMERINKVEYVNLVAQNKELGNVLTAIKGIINGERVSGNTLVKIAEYLGIDTRRDSRYESDRKLDNLGEKIFSMSNADGLFIHLQTEYDKLIESQDVKNFFNNPFTKFSLKDLCKKLIKIDWNGDALDVNNEQIKSFCKTRRGEQNLEANINTFVNAFNVRNTERINKNETELKNFPIFDVLGDDKLNNISINNDLQLQYKTGEGDNQQETIIGAENIVSLLGLEGLGKAQRQRDPGNTEFANENELKCTINKDEIKKARLNQLTDFVQLRSRNELITNISNLSLTADNIQRRNVFRNQNAEPKQEDIINLFNDLKSNIRADKNIPEIIQLIHTGLTKSRENKNDNTAFDAVTQLQTKIGFNGNDIDGKFGINTFNKVKELVEQQQNVDKRVSSNLKPKQFESTAEEYNLKKSLGLNMDTNIYTREGKAGVYYKNNEQIIYISSDDRCFIQTLSDFSGNGEEQWHSEYPTNCDQFNAKLNGIFDNAIRDQYGITDHELYSIKFDNNQYYMESYGVKTPIQLTTLTEGWICPISGINTYAECLKENFKILNLYNCLSSNQDYRGTFDIKEDKCLYLNGNKLEGIQPFDNGAKNYISLSNDEKNKLLKCLNDTLKKNK